MKPSLQLRSLLERPGLEQLLEAHDPLSSLLVQQAGIGGVWASSLTMSAAWGVPDRGMLERGHVLSNLEHMTQRLSIPVLFDGDTGHGDHNHFIQLVRALCLRNVAGVCIEDKQFPKRNSFVHSATQRLEDPSVFASKIRAGRDARPDPDFVIVARTEALIVGLGVDSALERAHRYADAGADAVLVHSKHTDFSPIARFMARWDRPTPVVCVPTTYADTPIEDFERARISLVIWANHMLRAMIRTMAETARHIAHHRHPGGLTLASLEEIFELQDLARIQEYDRVYGPTQGPVSDDT